MSLNFPDVCKTPAPPAPFIPVPYPDLGLNMQSAPFSPFVFVQFMPATNMGTLKVLTSGDEAGAMGGLITGIIKGPGKTTMGNPIVFVTGLPAENLALPTSGNLMNAPVGAQIVPSVVNVTYTYRDGSELAERATPVTASELEALTEIVRGEGTAEEAATARARWLAPGIALVRLGLFSSHADRETYNALRDLGHDAIDAVVLDLRGNPGGDAQAALRLAATFLPERTVLVHEQDSDGDTEPVVARGAQSHPWPLVVLVDGQSASAAEIVAAALQHHRRAVVVGQRTYGKATGQQAVWSSDGALRYLTVSQFRLPDGRAIDGCGVSPDVAVGDPTRIEEEALAVARGLSRRERRATSA